MKSHLRVLFTFILSFQLCWSPLHVYSQESSATGSQDYAGEKIDNPYLSTQSTSKTLEEQKAECLEISSKIWDESLNRCINKQESVEEREKFKECEAMTGLTERNACLEELRKKQMGDMKEEINIISPVVHGFSERRVNVSGPFSADAFFGKTMFKNFKEH